MIGISSFNFESLDAAGLNVLVVELPPVLSEGVVSPSLLARNGKILEG